VPKTHALATKQKYFALINQGMANKEACDTLGIDPKTGYAWRRGAANSSGTEYKQSQDLQKMRPPVPYDELTSEAQQAWDDFGYFRRRYFGRIASNWQEDAAYKFDKILWTPEKEYVVLNCPPGAGKSTLLHDIEAWLTIRNRGIRGILGSATESLARSYCLRLRRTFERRIPVQGDPHEIAAGRELDAEATLLADFGRFQPERSDLWRAESFIVAQLDDVSIEEKESTWASYGLDGSYLGNRVNIAVWDDVVTKKTMKTSESIQHMRDLWDDVAETRIEPDGAMFLVGQRLGPEDLYRYCLDKPGAQFEEEDDDDELLEPTFIEPEGDNISRKYHHIKYPAHFDELCQKEHKRSNAKQWPEGCLLDPIRLPWRELSALKEHRGENYETVYQQNDIDKDDVLVNRLWVTGGEDPETHEVFPGCYDTDRRYHEWPRLMQVDNPLSVLTVDPSPTKYFSIQWWAASDLESPRYLMDLIRKKLTIDQFLDEPSPGVYTGVLEDMYQLSKSKGHPLTHLIFEKNGAQRWLSQLGYFHRWVQSRNVAFFSHETQLNKADPDYGVQILGPLYKRGLIRLPNMAHGDMGYVISRTLVHEVTAWPNGTTDDCVMAQWFFEWLFPKLVTVQVKDIPKKTVPSWMRSRHKPRPLHPVS
jgi:hypothetical protein